MRTLKIKEEKLLFMELEVYLDVSCIPIYFQASPPLLLQVSSPSGFLENLLSFFPFTTWFVCLWWIHLLLQLYLDMLCSLCCIELGLLADCFTPGQ